MNHFRQDITYWPPGAPDGFGGRAVSALPPEALKGRWEDRQEEFMDSMQRVQLSNAIVFFPYPSGCGTEVEIEVDGYLYLGETNEVNPTKVTGAYLIRQKIVTPDLRRVKNELRVIL